jgi:hypothetical protein
LDQWIQYINSLPLAEKERYKWVALKIEIDNKQKTEDNSTWELEKLILWINREIYKHQVEALKSKISAWDANALKEYSELIQLAKINKIK